MPFWKKKDNLIIIAAVAFFLAGLAFWPEICYLRAQHVSGESCGASFQDQNGKSVNLSQFKGQPIILTFWATWCPACVKKMSTFNAFAQAFEAQGGKVIAVSEDNGMETVKAYLTRNGYENISPYLDNAGQLMATFGVTGLPTAVFIGPDGKEIDRLVGGVDWGNPALRDMIFKFFSIRMP